MTKFKKVMLFLFLVPCLSFCVTTVAKAETITNSQYVINSDVFNMLDNLYSVNNYSNYIMTSTRVYDNYRYTSYYYLCLTNNDLTISDSLNIFSSCDILYTYNSNDNVLNKSNNSLSVVNSIYYTNYKEKTQFDKFLICLLFSLVFIFVLFLILYVFDKIFSARGGGFRYEDI